MEKIIFYPKNSSASIQKFLVDYHRLCTSITDSRINPNFFISRFCDLKENFFDLKAKMEVRQLRDAPDYNIFQILNLTRNEVRTHSAFLAHMLNPKASHGQGVLFLRSFLQMCQRIDADFPDIPNFDKPKYWLVSTEESTMFGRLDIVIQNPLEGFLCVIENKIDALEGKDQLSRYSEWLEKTENIISYPLHALCYLTIRGSLSLTAGNHRYFPLSYKDNITIWLEEIMDQIQAPDVRVVVHQYQAVVANL